MFLPYRPPFTSRDTQIKDTGLFSSLLYFLRNAVQQTQTEAAGQSAGTIHYSPKL